MQQPRFQGGTESEAHVQRQSRPPLQRSIWRRSWTGSWTGFKDNEHFKDSEELAALQAKAEQAWEADKLAKRQAHSRSRSPIGSPGPPKSQSQAKITELEAAAKAAVEAVDEGKQKAEK